MVPISPRARRCFAWPCCSWGLTIHSGTSRVNGTGVLELAHGNLSGGGALVVDGSVVITGGNFGGTGSRTISSTASMSFSATRNWANIGASNASYAMIGPSLFTERHRPER